MSPLFFALIGLIIAAAFVIITIELLTGGWLKRKLKEKMANRDKGVIVIGGDKLSQLLSEVAEQTTEVSLDDLDMLLAEIDEEGNVDEIELVQATQGMDEAASRFVRENKDMIRVSSKA